MEDVFEKMTAKVLPLRAGFTDSTLERVHLVTPDDSARSVRRIDVI